MEIGCRSQVFLLAYRQRKWCNRHSLQVAWDCHTIHPDWQCQAGALLAASSRHTWAGTQRHMAVI